MNHRTLIPLKITVLCLLFIAPTRAFALKELSQLLLDKNTLQVALVIASDEKADPAMRQMAVSYLQEMMQGGRDQIASTRRIFAFQYIESIVIFCLAHVLVGVALLAAGFEFLAARKMRRKAAALQTELELGTQKLAFKTSSIALLYLLAALAFYFMYIRFVYPINVIGESA